MKKYSAPKLVRISNVNLNGSTITVLPTSDTFTGVGDCNAVTSVATAVTINQ